MTEAACTGKEQTKKILNLHGHKKRREKLPCTDKGQSKKILDLHGHKERRQNLPCTDKEQTKKILASLRQSPYPDPWCSSPLLPEDML
jgi:hypothetical protein